jgi:hypothetical protein
MPVFIWGGLSEGTPKGGMAREDFGIGALGDLGLSNASHASLVELPESEVEVDISEVLVDIGLEVGDLESPVRVGIDEHTSGKMDPEEAREEWKYLWGWLDWGRWLFWWRERGWSNGVGEMNPDKTVLRLLRD